MADIKNVAIIGAGQMGCGIAHVFALAGYRVLLNDINAAQLSAGLATIEKNLARQVASEKITQSEYEAALALISTHGELAALAEADLVIEAASEDENIKLQILEAVSALFRTTRFWPPTPRRFPSQGWPRRRAIRKILSACIL